MSPARNWCRTARFFLQAGVDGYELYQSATQRHTRWFGVFRVPIVICTNEWSSAAVLIDDNLKKWIKANDCHMLVREFSFQTSGPALEVAALASSRSCIWGSLFLAPRRGGE